MVHKGSFPSLQTSACIIYYRFRVFGTEFKPYILLILHVCILQRKSITKGSPTPRNENTISTVITAIFSPSSKFIPIQSATSSQNLPGCNETCQLADLSKQLWCYLAFVFICSLFIFCHLSVCCLSTCATAPATSLKICTSSPLTASPHNSWTE